MDNNQRDVVLTIARPREEMLTEEALARKVRHINKEALQVTLHRLERG